MKTVKSQFKFKGGVHPDCGTDRVRGKTIMSLFVSACVLPFASAFAGFLLDRTVMTDAYWRIWNDGVQAKIDADIEANRKADAACALAVSDGTEVRVEQLSHAFRFGAHSFRVGRRKTEEINRRYEENFARIFNQATIAFYWRAFEPFPGDCHFHTRPGDLESAFTSGVRDAMDPHSRYLSSPARSTDQFIEFAKSHGMIIHGHPLVWGSPGFMIPFWLYEQYCPESEKAFLQLPRKDPRTITRLYGEADWDEAWRKRIRELCAQYSEEEIAARCPTYLANMKRLYAKRIAEILDYCGDRVDSWDVVNESVWDWIKYSACRTGKPLTKSDYGILPPDYALEAFLTAARHVSAQPKLAINDNQKHEEYRKQIDDLVAHGARIDMVGWQFHIFKDADFDKIVAGEKIGWPFCSTPDDFRRIFETLGGSGRPVSISEITLPSPGCTAKSMMQQAIVARNYYRLWFSQPSCCGITWWHTLDDEFLKGVASENGTSGLMDSAANPKPSYRALDDLINRQWRTRLTIAVKDGKVTFRGFRGRYRLSWTDPDGKSAEKIFELR